MDSKILYPKMLDEIQMMYLDNYWVIQNGALMITKTMILKMHRKILNYTPHET